MDKTAVAIESHYGRGAVLTSILLMGETARAKFDNIARNLREGRLVVAQAVAEKAA